MTQMTYKVPIDGELDLHPFSPSDVSSIVNEYLRAAAEAGLTAVRLIHGRGIGVQRSIVHTTLGQHSAVTEFWDAPESHLGTTIAILKPSADRQASDSA